MERDIIKDCIAFFHLKLAYFFFKMYLIYKILLNYKLIQFDVNAIDTIKHYSLIKS